MEGFWLEVFFLIELSVQKRLIFLEVINHNITGVLWY